jgi:predicted glycoside hydrolase/deacetylase ChbG (UPF0249 family)
VSRRQLVVTADDYGIGAATSAGILDLGRRGIISGSVLLVNSPYAPAAVESWKRANRPMELGWHPCLTLDRPVLCPEQVPSLVDANGRFHRLGGFLSRVLTKAIRRQEIEAELRAQYDRFCDLAGQTPRLVNSHHHVQVFPPVGETLTEILGAQAQPPYVRRVREPLQMLLRISGARLKRGVLSYFGSHNAIVQEQAGLPGNDWLAGVTDPPCVADPGFFTHWLTQIPGGLVELTCHPGYEDFSLLGRDCTATDGHIARRVREYHLLAHPSFRAACERAGFSVVSFSDWMTNREQPALVAA